MPGSKSLQEKKRSTTTSFIAGAVSGLVVDVALFPLDTLKTRLQSHCGFWKSGGFKGIYKGIGPCAIGSAPCGAMFFTVYNGVKFAATPYVTPAQHPLLHMTSAAIGEWAACLIRVPTEIVKQRRQASVMGCSSSWGIVKATMKADGPRGLYSGFWTTVLRDVPFAVLQFPLWEFFKRELATVQGGYDRVTPSQGALCGAAAGAIAGAVTTPLDVIKTRIMLSVDINGKPKEVPVAQIMRDLYREKKVFGIERSGDISINVESTCHKSHVIYLPESAASCSSLEYSDSSLYVVTDNQTFG